MSEKEVDLVCAAGWAVITSVKPEKNKRGVFVYYAYSWKGQQSIAQKWNMGRDNFFQAASRKTSGIPKGALELLFEA
jgi:hypothetical protein